METLEEWPQSGSNERGTWVKHQDGRMECHYQAILGFQDYTEVSGALYKGPNHFWTFPEEFIATPTVHIMGNNASNAWLFCSSAFPSTTAVTYSVFSVVRGSNIQTTIGLAAFGRWK